MKNKLETLSMSDNTVVEITSDEENSTDLSETVETIDKLDSINVDLQTLIKESRYNTNLHKEDIPQETKKETVKVQETSEKNQNIARIAKRCPSNIASVVNVSSCLYLKMSLLLPSLLSLLLLSL